MKNPKKQNSGVITGILFPMGLICLFAFCSLALALMGGRAYKGVQEGIDDNFGSTVTANYLRTKLTQNNIAGAVSLRESESGTMLVIATMVGERPYETRIFMHDGTLRESFQPAGQPHDPLYGIAIAQLQACEFSLSDDGLFIAEIYSPAGVRSRAVYALVKGGSS